MTNSQQHNIRVLIIEDMAVDADLIQLELKRGDVSAECTVVATLAEAYEKLSSNAYDVILADFAIPGSSGHDILRTCKQLSPTTPFIFVSGALGEDVAIDMLRDGADDYVLKHRMMRLVPAVRRALEESEQQRELAIAHRELFQTAHVKNTFLQVVPDSMLVLSDTCVLEEYYHGQDVQSTLYFGGFIGTALDTVDTALKGVCSVLCENIKAMTAEEISDGSFKYNLDKSDEHLGDACFEARIARNSHGKNWVVVVKDISASEMQRKAVEASHEELRKADELKSHLLANLSHELRTPMNGIIGVASLLSESATTTEHQELATMLNSSSQRLMHGLANVLCLAEIESGSYRKSDIAFEIQEIVAGIQDTHLNGLLKERVTLNIVDKTEGQVISGDFTSVLTICRNLLSNSCKFTHHGSISLAFELQSKDNGVQLCIDLQDTGIGIAKEFIDTAFHRFTQESTGLNRGYEGAGLGLSVVSKLTHLLGGSISVDTNPGEGTSFTLLLPVIVQNGAFDSKNHYFDQASPDTTETDTRVLLYSADDTVRNQVKDEVDGFVQLLSMDTFGELETQLSNKSTIAVVLPETRAAEVMLRLEKTVEQMDSFPSIVVWGKNNFTCYNHAPVTGSRREASIHSFHRAEFKEFLNTLQSKQSRKRLV